jgi:2-dehydropantoate 2-reductase
MYKKTMGEVLNDPTTLKMYESCVNEAISVSKSQNISISDDCFQAVMDTSFKTRSDSKTSLSLDIQKGGKNEIETLNGTIVKLAKLHNIDVPVNELIYTSLRG